ncbi:biotin--[acetyl-CoA-carboxylase] ligase [Halomarina ordinaria]|uniref:Biotin--[acetyl-CoA-carboxylase] ligase n=1 Tax=Halomarina ordinaria TaxID=3033939 RepID=A0ABD5U4Y4_9EURY|nr:biotin--[acetyl-CoA-carboxylase] ligase [Halomarina sp. PSRA2]
MNETRRRVLAALADGPVPGPALAEELDVSRAAVWKHVEALREAGFEVESGEAGYALVSVPDEGLEALEFGLDAPFTVEHHDSLDSTNRRARVLAESGATDVVVVADEQTGGRGRLDRTWESPPGGVYLSVVCRPDLSMTRAPLYTLAASVAIARTTREAGVDARIKWPNDVLAGEERRKLAGIRTEVQGETDRVAWLVCGIGVNADATREDLPEGATSLRAEGATVSRRVFVQRLLETFDELRGNPDVVLPAWRDLALTLGQRVRVETPGGEVVGEAVDVEEPGTLLVDTGEGVVRVSAGDCEHLRPV